MNAVTSTPAEASPDTTVSGLRVWASATAAASLSITTLDALLLQQKKSFFTGGFLSAVNAATLPQATGFLAVSLLVDASIVGITAAILLWLTSRAGLTRSARLALVGLGAVAPLVIWDFIAYTLLAYLGDAFDLGLMFELTGRSTGEMLAVSSAHLAAPLALTACAVVGLGGIVWALNRFNTRRHTATASRRLLAATCGLFVGGLVTHAVASSTSDVAEDGLRRKASGQIYTWLLAELTDFDRDGYGVGGRTGDPAPFDAAIYPYALDVPGNGIDENGVGGDLPSAEPVYVERGVSPATWRERPDIVLFVLESFRADVLGRVVNGTPVTPTLDGLAQEGISSARAFSHNGYTTQSRFHLFTGSLADLRRDGSLVDDFKAQGYQVAYFSGQDESFGGAELRVGFERAEVAYDARIDHDKRYSRYTTAGSLAVSHAVLRSRIEGFLATRDSSRPLFLYVNFHDTHFPYHHGEMEALISNRSVPQSDIAPGRRAEVLEMYDNAAANVDRAVGSTLESVTRALAAPPAVIVTADHGESLFDEGFLGHGYALNDMQTRIPLIVRGLPMEIAEPFGQTDLRDGIAAALSRAGAEHSRPRIIDDPRKTVFQYLGNIHRPRQIAFLSSSGRLVYDFRDRRVLLPAGRSLPPEGVSGADEVQFLGLIQFWERMMLARSNAGASPEE